MRHHWLMWLWDGWRPVYDRRDAIALARQLIRFGDLPTHSRICLLTDTAKDWHAQALGKLGVEELPLWPEIAGLKMGPVYPAYPTHSQRGVPNCFRRLKILDRNTQAGLGIEPGDHVYSLDLDSIVRGSLRHLTRLAGSTFAAMNGKGSRIHGSCWGFKAGEHCDVWDTFDPARSPAEARKIHNGTRHVGSDQAWLSIKLPTAPLWTEADGLYSWPRTYPQLAGPRADLAFCSFAGPHKPRSETVKHITPWLWDHAVAAYNN
jgi:hypothetical protein